MINKIVIRIVNKKVNESKRSKANNINERKHAKTYKKIEIDTKTCKGPLC